MTPFVAKPQNQQNHCYLSSATRKNLCCPCFLNAGRLSTGKSLCFSCSNRCADLLIFGVLPAIFIYNSCFQLTTIWVNYTSKPKINIVRRISPILTIDREVWLWGLPVACAHQLDCTSRHILQILPVPSIRVCSTN